MNRPAQYAGTRAGVKARATLEQAEELGWVLDQLGERSGQLGRGDGRGPRMSLSEDALLPNSGRAVIQV
jgi:hypothetical protein